MIKRVRSQSGKTKELGNKSRRRTRKLIKDVTELSFNEGDELESIKLYIGEEKADICPFSQSFLSNEQGYQSGQEGHCKISTTRKNLESKGFVLIFDSQMMERWQVVHRGQNLGKAEKLEALV